MRRVEWVRCGWITLLLCGAQGLTQTPLSASAAPAAGQPYAIRGIRLGITLAEFRQASVVTTTDENSTAPVMLCTGDKRPKFLAMSRQSITDIGVGITDCEPFAPDPAGNIARQWIGLGNGGVLPTYSFIDDGTGTKRLFRVAMTGDRERGAYDRVLFALTYNYGKPKAVSEPFQVRSGAIFTSLTSRWSNGASRITMVERCGELDTFCLTYNHAVLTERYDALVAQQRAEEASKI